MTYEIYAMFSEGSYLVATSNDREHGMDVAERVCKELGQWPMAFTALTRGEHTIRGSIFSFEELKKRG